MHMTIETDKTYMLHERGGLTGLKVKVTAISDDDSKITVELLEVPKGITPWMIGDPLTVWYNELRPLD